MLIACKKNPNLQKEAAGEQVSLTAKSIGGFIGRTVQMKNEMELMANARKSKNAMEQATHVSSVQALRTRRPYANVSAIFSTRYA